MRFFVAALAAFFFSLNPANSQIAGQDLPDLTSLRGLFAGVASG